jgi:hypothetical protein
MKVLGLVLEFLNKYLFTIIAFVYLKKQKNQETLPLLAKNSG